MAGLSLTVGCGAVSTCVRFLFLNFYLGVGCIRFSFFLPLIEAKRGDFELRMWGALLVPFVRLDAVGCDLL